MVRLQSFPFRRAMSNRVRVTRWHLQDAQVLNALPDALPEWDAATSMDILIQAEVDSAGVRMDCGLSDDAALRLTAVWYSSGTGLRGSGSSLNVDAVMPSQQVLVNLHVDGALLAEKIIVELHLVLVSPGTDPQPLAPRRPGSRLWQAERIVQLEGSGSRFPVEVIDFAEAGWLPADSTWYLEWDPDNLDLTVLGSVRLLINSRCEPVMQAITMPVAQGAPIRHAIRFDVGRTLILGALIRDDFVCRDGNFEEGSVGLTVFRLLCAIFPSDTLLGLRQQLRAYPFKFECMLQDRLRLFRDM